VIGIDWGFASRAFRVGAGFSRRSFENHSISLAVTRLTERPLASKLVGPVGRSQVIGIDWGFASRAFRMGISFSRATFENHSISLAVTRLTERPLASKLVGPVGCVLPRDRNCWGIRPARVQNETQFSVQQHVLALFCPSPGHVFVLFRLSSCFGVVLLKFC
jgi:hypothetical protein